VSSGSIALCNPGALLSTVCGILQGLLGLNIGIGVSNLIVYAAEADCPAGYVALGGGVSTGALAGVVATSAPTDGTGTEHLVTNGQVPHGWLGIDTGISTLNAYAICSPGS